MADTVDSLSIELTASTQSAEDSIQKVIDKLSALKTAVTGASNFNKIVQGIARIAAVANGIDSDAGRKLAHLAAGITALSKVGDLSNLKDAGKNLSGVVRAVNGMGQGGGSGLGNLADSIRQTDKALDGIKDSDVSKLGSIQDALTGEMTGSLNTSNVASESAALGGMGAMDIGGSDVAASLGEIASSAAIAGGELEDLLSKNGELSGEFETLLEDATQSAKALTDTGDSSRFARMSLEEMESTIGSVTEQLQAMAGTAETAGDAVQNAMNMPSIPPETGPYDTERIGQFDVSERFADFRMSPLEDDFASTANAADGASESVQRLWSSFSGFDVLKGVGGLFASAIDGIKKFENAIGGGLFTAIAKAGRGILGFFRSIVRIAKYRLIRSALKDMGQSFKDLYGWSKKYGTDFSDSMDKINTAFLYLRNSIAAMVAPLIDLLAPVLDVIIDKIVDVLNWFNQFFAAISGADTYTAAVKYVQKWGDTFEQAGDKAKDTADKIKRTILGFDEINKIQKASDGGSGGSGSAYSTGYEYMFEEKPIVGGFKGFSDAIETALQDTLSRITLIIGGAELAVGAILAFSGANVPLGIALMATGAVTMGSAIIANWEGIPDEIKVVVGAIEAALGGGLAVGAVLAFSSGNIGLGIGMMVAALSLEWSAVTVVWTTLKDKIGGQIRAIEVLVGGALIGVGAVLAFSGHPAIGLAMLIAGLSVEAVAIDWGKLTGKVGEKINELKGLIIGAEIVFGVIFLLTGNIPLGLALLIAGGVGAGLELVNNWGNIADWFKERWAEFKKAAEDTWDSLKEIGAGIWDKIKEGISGAVKNVGSWIQEHIFKPFVDAWNWLLGLFGGGDDEANFTMNASGVGEQIIEETDTETMRQLKALGASMGDAIKAGILDSVRSVSDDIWNTIKGNWKNNDRTLTVTVKSNVIRGDWSDTAYLAANMEDIEITRSITSEVKKGSWDNEAWTAAGLTSFSPIRTITSVVKKGDWDDTAWLAANMTSYPISRTVTSIVKKGDWDNEAWAAACLTSFSPIRTVTVTVKKGDWDDTAWLAASMTSYPVTRTVTSVVQKGNWDNTAWEAASMTSFSPTRTVTAVVKKGDWNDTAWTAANMTSYFPTRTVTSVVQKGSWNDTAWLAASMTSYTTIRTISVATNISSWFSDAVWNFIQGTDNIVKWITVKLGFGESGDPYYQSGDQYTQEWFDKHILPLEKQSVTIPVSLGKTWDTGGGGKTSGGGAGRDKTNKALETLGLVGLESTVDIGLTYSWSSVIGGALFLLGLTGLSEDVDMKMHKAWGNKKPLAVLGLAALAAAVKITLKLVGTIGKAILKALGIRENSEMTVVGPEIPVITSKMKLENGTAQQLANDIQSQLPTFTVKVGLDAQSSSSAIKTANGGIFQNGLWSAIPQYAGGTTNIHGSLFLAGEAGPEIVGHVGGRTEVLNKSQLASTMYAAVRSAMGGVRLTVEAGDGSAESGSEADYETMYRAMYDAFSAAMARGDERDREKVALLRQISEKEFRTDISTSDINRAQTRANRRAGITVVPVGT